MRMSFQSASSSSATIWARAVPTPCPISAFVMCTVTRPSGVMVSAGLGSNAAAAAASGAPKSGKRMPTLRVKAFDRGDLLAGRLGEGRLARADRATVEMHGARAALGHAAAELRAGQAQPLADHPQERRVRIGIDRLGLPVDQESRHITSRVTGPKEPLEKRCAESSTFPHEHGRGLTRARAPATTPAPPEQRHVSHSRAALRLRRGAANGWGAWGPCRGP